MNRTLAAWNWSLGELARSYQTIVVLAVFMALWMSAAYAWLGLPSESWAVLMFVSVLWAIVQILAAVVMVGGVVCGAAETAISGSKAFPLAALWTMGRKKILTTLVFCAVALTLAWLCNTIFDWINGHSVEVASFLTFHSEKPVSHELIGQIYVVVERLLWIALAGFLLSFLTAILHLGWREARRQALKLLAGNFFRPPFLTDLMTVAVFGGVAYELAIWHPLLGPGFWDYAQAIVRLSLILILIAAGALYWPLALARLQLPAQDTAKEPETYRNP